MSEVWSDLKNNTFFLLAVVLALVLAFFCGRWTKPAEVIPFVVRDTTYIVVQDPIIIKGAKAKTIYRDRVDSLFVRDTVLRNDTLYYETPAFTACLDTIIKQDTLGIKYYFPENLYDVFFYPKPDSVRVITITVPQSVKWYESKEAFGIYGLIIGFSLGRTD